MIHDVVYHGNGGFDWETLYHMPIWLRRFTYNRIALHVKDQNDAQQNSTQQTAGGTTRQIDFTKPPSDMMIFLTKSSQTQNLTAMLAMQFSTIV
jgi:hypothetical protein